MRVAGQQFLQDAPGFRIVAKIVRGHRQAREPEGFVVAARIPGARRGGIAFEQCRHAQAEGRAAMVGREVQCLFQRPARCRDVAAGQFVAGADFPGLRG